MYPLRADPIILVFEFETKIWSEIRLNLPSNRIYYQFHVDEDCVLGVVTYAKVDEEIGDPLKLRTTSIRILLKKPDKLVNLCWFQARDCGLSNKSQGFFLVYCNNN